jgi:hypothetical protein
MLGVIQVEMDEDFECHCGNNSHSKGFHPCDWGGRIVEPDEGWNNQWYCDNCGQVYYDTGR